MAGSLNTVETKIIRWSRGVSLIGLIGLMLLAGITVGEVLLRWLFNYPILGVSDVSRLIVTIVAASCLFPLSDNPNFSKIIGTRHRAALGLTEQTDATVVMVSEETGEISVASEGRFIPVVNRDRLVNILKNLMVGERAK